MPSTVRVVARSSLLLSACRMHHLRLLVRVHFKRSLQHSRGHAVHMACTALFIALSGCQQPSIQDDELQECCIRIEDFMSLHYAALRNYCCSDITAMMMPLA
eukprot:6964-Heterococcus_DN1.PRE.2